MKLFDRIATWLIVTAANTPYWHLEGYMNRYWLIPFRPGSRSVSESGSADKSATDWPGQFPVLAFFFALFGISARVHHILRSDDDRAFHDHPWNFTTIILKGGYYEVTPAYDESGLYLGEETIWYGPGSILRRKATDYHRLELPEGQTAWTLFICGKWRQRWGFMSNPDIKMYFRDYLEDKATGKITIKGPSPMGKSIKPDITISATGAEAFRAAAEKAKQGLDRENQG